MKRTSEFAASIKSTKGQNLRVLVGLRHIRVIAEQKSLEVFGQGLLDREILGFSEDLVEISLLMSPEAEQIDQDNLR